MTRDPSVWSGHAAVVDGVLEAELIDTFGYITVVRGTPNATGWTLSARVVVPEGLAIPWLDDPKGTG